MNMKKIYDKTYFTTESTKGYPYGYFPEYKDFTIALFEKFKPRTSLDVGCATGILVNRLVEIGVDAYGIDISPDAISMGGSIKNRLKEIDISHEKLPFNDNFFDLITMLDVIEHIEDETNILNELKRVLKNNGVVYIMTPTLGSSPATGHINLHNLNYWLKLFKHHHFNVKILKRNLFNYTWKMAEDMNRKWINLPISYKLKNRPKIIIRFIESLPFNIRTTIIFINGYYKQLKNDRITYRFILTKVLE